LLRVLKIDQLRAKKPVDVQAALEQSTEEANPWRKRETTKAGVKT
jgi:hypothetical protein